MRDDEELVTVAAYSTVGEAEAARLMLESHGVTCFLADAETVNMAWYISNAVGGIKLQVPSSEVTSATRILKTRVVRRNEDDYGLARREVAQPGEEMGDSAEEQDETSAESQADQIVDRAWRAAIFGLLLCPPLLHFYSLLLLLQLPGSSSTVSQSKRALLYGTAALDVVLILTGLVLMRFLWFGV